MFAFGHGLGYTSWAYEELSTPDGGYRAGRDLRLRVVVRNTGSRPGREVVQAYLAGQAGDRSRPVRVLAAFGLAAASPGELAEVTIRIPARVFGRGDEATGGSTWPPAPFTMDVGRSSRDLRLSIPL